MDGVRMGQKRSKADVLFFFVTHPVQNSFESVVEGCDDREVFVVILY